MARVTFDHHGGGLKIEVAHDVNALAGDEIRLELSDVQEQRTVETEGGLQEEMTCAGKRYKKCTLGARCPIYGSKRRTRPRVHPRAWQ